MSLFEPVEVEHAAQSPALSPKRARGAHHYVCPQCWQRVSLQLAPAEPPLCAFCDERMIYEPPAVPRERREPEEEPGMPDGE